MTSFQDPSGLRASALEAASERAAAATIPSDAVPRPRGAAPSASSSSRRAGGSAVAAPAGGGGGGHSSSPNSKGECLTNIFGILVRARFEPINLQQVIAAQSGSAEGSGSGVVGACSSAGSSSNTGSSSLTLEGGAGAPPLFGRAIVPLPREPSAGKAPASTAAAPAAESGVAETAGSREEDDGSSAAGEALTATSTGLDQRTSSADSDKDNKSSKTTSANSTPNSTPPGSPRYTHFAVPPFCVTESTALVAYATHRVYKQSPKILCRDYHHTDGHCGKGVKCEYMHVDRTYINRVCDSVHFEQVAVPLASSGGDTDKGRVSANDAAAAATATATAVAVAAASSTAEQATPTSAASGGGALRVIRPVLDDCCALCSCVFSRALLGVAGTHGSPNTSNSWQLTAFPPVAVPELHMHVGVERFSFTRGLLKALRMPTATTAAAAAATTGASGAAPAVDAPANDGTAAAPLPFGLSSGAGTEPSRSVQVCLAHAEMPGGVGCPNGKECTNLHVCRALCSSALRHLRDAAAAAPPPAYGLGAAAAGAGASPLAPAADMPPFSSSMSSASSSMTSGPSSSSSRVQQPLMPHPQHRAAVFDGGASPAYFHHVHHHHFLHHHQHYSNNHHFASHLQPPPPQPHWVPSSTHVAAALAAPAPPHHHQQHQQHHATQSAAHLLNMAHHHHLLAGAAAHPGGGGGGANNMHFAPGMPPVFDPNAAYPGRGAPFGHQPLADPGAATRQ